MLAHTQTVHFTNSHGQKLSAKLDTPLLKPIKAYAIFVHCFTCSKDISIAARISKELANTGIATLRFDFTGLGNSEGEFSKTSFSTNLQDLESAFDYMKTNHQFPSLLVGHSLGGTAALAIAEKFPQLKALVTVGSPSQPSHVGKHLEKEADHYTFNLGQKPFVLCQQFVDDIENIDVEKMLPKYKLDNLILHSPMDRVVNIEHAEKLYKSLSHPKSFISLDQADHLLSKKDDALYVGQLIASWFAKHLPKKIQAESHENMGSVLVQEIKQPYTQKITTSSHVFTADEPKDIGGRDLGPNPYELLLAALGACTSMTLRMYAKRKNLDLQSIKIELKHQKIHAKDCEDCETKSGKIDLIERKLYLTGELNSEQRQRLLEIADRCPVHKTLESENKITTELA